MPNRESTRDLGTPLRSGGELQEGKDQSPAAQGQTEARSFGETSFEAHDERLRAELERYDRDHRRTGSPLGGSRFGFFALSSQERLHTEAPYDFDPDYLHWRDQQMQRHDHDYADWRRHQQELYDDEYHRFRVERRDDFHERFQDWRAKRDAAQAAASTTPSNPDDKL